MIDIHLHILPGVDDGSPSMESSLEMAQLALESGVKSVIATPHCNLPDTICLNARQMQGQVQRFREALLQAEIPLKVYGGMEIFGTPQTAQRLQSGQLCTLAGSRYPLIEFPFVDYGREATEILDSVLRLGLRPIVAHPELYPVRAKTAECMGGDGLPAANQPGQLIRALWQTRRGIGPWPNGA